MISELGYSQEPLGGVFSEDQDTLEEHQDPESRYPWEPEPCPAQVGPALIETPILWALTNPCWP